MKLQDILLLGLSIAFIIIGIDQTIVLGFGQAYWAFMIALAVFFIYTFRKSRAKQPENPVPPVAEKPLKPRKKRR